MLLESTSDRTENILVITDVFFKLTVAIPTKYQSAETTASVLVKEWFLKYIIYIQYIIYILQYLQLGTENADIAFRECIKSKIVKGP